MRENGPSPVHQAQLALHGKLGAGNVHQLSTGDFVLDGDQRFGASDRIPMPPYSARWLVTA